jgi:hypothetical protein
MSYDTLAESVISLAESNDVLKAAVEEVKAEAIAAKDSAIINASSVQGAADQLAAMQDALNQIPIDPTLALSVFELQAKSFDSVQGTATYGAITARLGGWIMPNAVASYLAVALALPSHWAKMDVYVKWVNMVANAGNVVLGGEIHKWAAGESINATPSGNSSVVPATAVPWVVVETKVGSDLVLDSTRMTTLRIARQGASGSETLPNSIAILSVRLQKKP